MASPSCSELSVLKPRAIQFNQNFLSHLVLRKLAAAKSTPSTFTSRHTPLLEPTTPLGPTLLNGKFPMEPFYPKPHRSMGQYLISKTPLMEQFLRHAPLLEAKTPLMEQISVRQGKSFFPASTKTPLMEHNISMMQEKSLFPASNTDSFAMNATAGW